MFDVYLAVPALKEPFLVQVLAEDNVDGIALSLGTALVSAGHAATNASLVRIAAHEGFVLSSSHHEMVVAALRLLRTGSVHVVIRVIGKNANRKVVQYVGNAVCLPGREPLPRCLVRASKQLPKKFCCLPKEMRLSLTLYPSPQAPVGDDFGRQLYRFSERLMPVLAHRCQSTA